MDIESRSQAKPSQAKKHKKQDPLSESSSLEAALAKKSHRDFMKMKESVGMKEDGKMEGGYDDIEGA
ncbi:hypothetical protein EAF00_001639 [Botryotinia globosa]|nr:hypothetical protein EAF00_001639 [Botryotinia globosa]